eukprot:280293-Chlamydomonas_euryale.AAC.2
MGRGRKGAAFSVAGFRVVRFKDPIGHRKSALKTLLGTCSLKNPQPRVFWNAVKASSSSSHWPAPLNGAVHTWSSVFWNSAMASSSSSRRSRHSHTRSYSPASQPGGHASTSSSSSSSPSSSSSLSSSSSSSSEASEAAAFFFARLILRMKILVSGSRNGSLCTSKGVQGYGLKDTG